MHPAFGLAAYSLAAYWVDVPMRRQQAAERARQYARRRGLPVLNVGAGTPETSWQGACLDGDVNIDLNGRRDIRHGTPGCVTYGDAQDLREFPTGTFGAVLASHILEHLPHPERALREWSRVAGHDPRALFVVTPLWWDPVAWIHPGHLNHYPDGQGCLTGCRAVPLRRQASPLGALLRLK